MFNRIKADVSWFFVMNILITILASCQIILGLIFVLIILSKRAHQSISSGLAVNSVLSVTLFAMAILLISVHMWECDNHPEQCREDALCLLRDYVNDVTCIAAIYSFAVQSVYRLFVSIFPHQISLQKFYFVILLCIIQWLIALLYPIYFIYINPQLQFDVISYVCVIPENPNGHLIAYILSIEILIPSLIIISVYIRLFFSLRRLRLSSDLSSVLLIVQRKHELRIAKRVVILFTIFALGSLAGIVFQSVNSSPTFRYRIYYLNMIMGSFGTLLYLCTITSVIRQQCLRWKEKLQPLIDCRRPRAITPEQNRC